MAAECGEGGRYEKNTSFIQAQGDAGRERQRSSVAATPGAFDISEGNITLSENGGYKQIDKLDAVVSTGIQGDEQNTVTGSTGEFGIHVERGTSPTIQVQAIERKATSRY